MGAFLTLLAAAPAPATAAGLPPAFTDWSEELEPPPVRQRNCNCPAMLSLNAIAPKLLPGWALRLVSW